ncbi:hypothetical protein [Luteolibacter sp. LG18]|uniref:hypothetical protein n=1 Tax=Luteolibacter sp. LG18 TaxID=2819286 RepID=UPI0030C77AF1
MTEPDWKSCNEEDFWSYIAWHLSKAGIESVLVGGAVVAIYSEGLYRSGDVDLVLEGWPLKPVAEVLEPLGFRPSGRHWSHPSCAHLYLEFPPGPVSLGEQYPVIPAELEKEGQRLKLLSPTDCVKDRLAAWIHWKSRSRLDQAALVASRQDGAVDFEEVRRWCGKEGAPTAYDDLLAAVQNLGME